MSYGARPAPPVVRLLVMLQYLTGALALAGAAWLGWFAVRVRAEPSYGGPDTLTSGQTSAIVALAAVLAAASGALAIVLARNLRRGRPWARTVVLLLSGLGVAAVVASFLTWPTPPSAALAAVYPLLCVLLLSTPDARSWFRRAPARLA